MKTLTLRLKKHAFHMADDLRTDKIAIFNPQISRDCNFGTGWTRSWDFNTKSIQKAFSPKFGLRSMDLESQDLKPKCGCAYYERL